MFSVTFNSNRFIVKFCHSEEMPTSFNSTVYIPDVDMYDGAYEAEPSVNEQVFETKDKMMIDDFTVKKIPYFETSNEYGNTVYIASEVN